jgi:hypothetical protein
VRTSTARFLQPRPPAGPTPRALRTTPSDCHFRKGRPLLFTAVGERAPLEGTFKGASLFLVLSGPSLAGVDLSFLQERGMVSMAVNNAWSLVKPTLWVSVDPAGRFMDQGWKDPTIMKFVPGAARNSRIREEKDGTLVTGEKRVGGMPNVWYFARNTHFDPKTFLREDAVSWGSGKDPDAMGIRNARSVMLPALRLSHHLGFSRVFLLGCDFNMQEDGPAYAFEEEKSAKARRANNRMYRVMDLRFKALHPVLVAAGLQVFNCNPRSGLTAFPFASLESAVSSVRGERGKGTITKGWYT